jgi:hypothetical protein
MGTSHHRMDKEGSWEGNPLTGMLPQNNFSINYIFLEVSHHNLCPVPQTISWINVAQQDNKAVPFQL